ncbi:Ig-like domain-containing protein [Caballeronia sp. KNU42]
MTTILQTPSKTVITSVGLAVDGGIANSTRPVITGTADAGTIVDIYDGVRMIGTAVVAANGTWSFTPPADLKAGKHAFAAISVNSDGEFGPSSTPVSVTVPSGTPVTPATPVVSGMTDDAGHVLSNPTNDPHPKMNGTGAPGDTITMYDGVTPVGTAIIDGTGHWVVMPNKDLASGPHDFYVIETSPAGVPSVPSGHYPVVIDASVPVPPVITSATDSVGPVQGQIPAGGTTDDTRPAFAGTGAKGDIVKLYDGNTLIGSAMVDSNGTWSIKPVSALANGIHDVYATDTNTAGTTSGQSTHFKFIVDTSTPARPPSPTLTDDNGATIPAGGTTTDAHPHINGTGTAGDTIKVYDGSTMIGSTIIGSDGKWSFTPSQDLGPGVHDIRVTETNAAGTPSLASDPVHVTVNISAPATPVIYLTDDNGAIIPANSTTSDNHPHINGTGTAGNIIMVLDSAKLIGSTTVGANGQWTFTPSSLNDGLHGLQAYAVNAAGMFSNFSNGIVVTVATSAPATPVIYLTDDNGAIIPANSTTADNHPHINGTGAAGTTIMVLDSAKVIGSTTVGTNGQWTFTPSNLSDGLHGLQAVAVNAAGTFSNFSNGIVVTVNTSVPATPATPTLTDDSGTTIPAGSTTSDNHPHINGTGTTGDIITVYDGSTVLGSTTIGPNGKWTFTPANMSVGPHSINVTETNAAGTSSAHSGSIGFTYSNVAPSPVITSVVDAVGPVQGNVPSGGTTDDTRPTISGTGIPGDTLYIYLANSSNYNGQPYGAGDTVVDANGHWSIRLNKDMPSGLNTITATQFAPGTAQSAASTAWVLTVDTSTPATPATPTLTNDSGAAIPAGSTTNDGHPHINGTGKAGDIIKVYDNGYLIGSTTIGGDGKWSFTPSTDLSGGSHSLNVIEVNPSGISSAASSAVNIVISTVAFAPAIVSVAGAVGPMTGNVAPGAMTTDGQPTVTGTGHAGDIIKLYDGSTLLGSTTVATNGTWSFKPSAMLANGNHNLTATDTNGAGQTSSASAVFGFATQYVVITGAKDSRGNAIAKGGSCSGPVTFTAYVDPSFNGSLVGVYLTGGGFKGENMLGADRPVVTNGLITFTLTKDFWSGHGFTSTSGNFTIDFAVNQPGAAHLYASTSSAPSVDWTVYANLSGVSATMQVMASDVAVPDHGDASALASPQPEHHTVVSQHDAFVGKAANGNETVDMNADPSTYFKEATAHIEGAKGGTIDTLHLTGDHQVLDLTSLTGKTAAAKISGIEVVDLGGQHNTLKLSLIDVLNLGETDLFQKDGKQQMMVQGKDGDAVDVSNTHIANVADGDWEAHGTAVVAGVTYNVYEHTGAHTELLVQQGVQFVVH